MPDGACRPQQNPILAPFPSFVGRHQLNLAMFGKPKGGFFPPVWRRRIELSTCTNQPWIASGLSHNTASPRLPARHCGGTTWATAGAKMGTDTSMALRNKLYNSHVARSLLGPGPCEAPLTISFLLFFGPFPTSCPAHQHQRCRGCHGRLTMCSARTPPRKWDLNGL